MPISAFVTNIVPLVKKKNNIFLGRGTPPGGLDLPSRINIGSCFVGLRVDWVAATAQCRLQTGKCKMNLAMKANFLAASITGASLLSAVLLLGGCSLPSWSKPWPKSTPKSNPTAEVLLKQGTDYLDKKKYSKAIIQFERIREEHPFSAQAVEVELKLGEAYHLSKKYSEAESAYKDFLSLRPTNKEVPFVIYRLGLLHFDQFTTIDRDQKNITTAMGYFATVIKDYPQSLYVADSKKKWTQCRRYLAEREYYVGSFYLKEKKYAAAKERFERIVRLYLDTPVGIKALYHLGETYRLENNSVKASLAYEALIKHYPQSPLAKKAQVQLAQLGKVQYDPLAQLLIRDGRPVFASNEEAGQQMVSSGAIQNPKSPIPNRSALNLATKKEVVFEESGVNGDGKKKGFFRRMVGALNPFSSSSDEKKDGDKQSENGTDVAKANKNGKGNPTDRPGGLTSEIDASLKEKGIDAGDHIVALRPPTPDLPEITEEPAPPPANAKAHTKEVLGKVDEGLKKEGKIASEVPEPPKLIVTRRSKTKAKGKKTQFSLSSSGILGAIDKKLRKKGIELPKEGEASTTGDLQAATPVSQPASRPTIELSPRLSRETTPFLIDPGEFQLEEKPEAAEKAKDPRSAAAARSANPQEIAPTFQLPASVTKGPTILPEKKETSKGDEESATEDAFGQIKGELGKFKQLMGPLFGQQSEPN